MKLKDNKANKAKHQAGHEEHWELVEQTEGLDRDFDKNFDELEKDVKKRLSKNKKREEDNQ